ncbi:MAG: CDP-alcohol phosphatidyltransferase family protein [Candidatus Omnitrophica bacterium]|nr:CDP-alcohol phosphatidyltransferase family protein [Candidatus Omnitrophota bacterium]
MQIPLNRVISGSLTPWLIKVGLTPHQTTLLSLGSGLLAVWNFLQGTGPGWVWGAVFFEASYVLDNCDGEIARLTGRSSGFGSWLDLLSDWTIHCLFFIALGQGLSRVDPEGVWGRLGGFASVGVFLTYATFLLEQIQQRGREALRHPDPPASETGKGLWGKLKMHLRADFSLVVLGSALVGQMAWLLWGGVFGAFLYWVLGVSSIALRGMRSFR